jgi:thioredoxin 1
MELESMSDFNNCLEQNNGVVILRFTADWCGPCKKIEPFVMEHVNKLHEYPHIYYYVIDVDESLDIFAHLKKKRVVNGIPAILVYKKGNTNIFPDDSCLGGDVNEVNALFSRILN